MDLTGGSDDEPESKPTTFTPTKPTMTTRRAPLITSTADVNLISDDEDESELEKRCKLKGLAVIDQKPDVPRPTTATCSATPPQSSHLEQKPRDTENLSIQSAVHQDAIPDVIGLASASKNSPSYPDDRWEGPSSAGKAATVTHSPPLAWRPAPASVINSQNDPKNLQASESKDTEMADAPIQDDQAGEESMDIDEDPSTTDVGPNQPSVRFESPEAEIEDEAEIAARMPLSEDSLEAFQASLKTILADLRQAHEDMVKVNLWIPKRTILLY